MRVFAKPSLRLPTATRSFYPIWRTTVFLQALVAFGALFSTREVPLWVSVIFMSAWLVGLVRDKPPSWARPWMNLVLTIFVLVTLVVMTILSRQDFFQRIMDLLLFLVLSKCYTLRTSRDYLQAQVLCFFVILCTAVITVSFTFVFFFLLYLLFATIGLAMFGIARQWEATEGAAAETPIEGAPRAGVLPARFFKWSFAAFVFMMGLVLAFFVFVPHYSLESLDAPLARRSAPPEHIAGFSEEVTLGEFKQISPDSTLVMQVEMTLPEGRTMTRPNNLRMRGVALEYYDEKRWMRSPNRNEPIIYETSQVMTKMESTQRGTVIRMKVSQNPDVTMRVFAPPIPILIDFGSDRRIRYDPETMAIQIVGIGSSRESTYTNPFSYSVQTNFVEDGNELLSAIIKAGEREKVLKTGAYEFAHDEDKRAIYWEELKRTQKDLGKLSWASWGKPFNLNARDRLINLQLPQTDLTRQIRELTDRIAKGPSKAAVVQQCVRHLQLNYEYTVQPMTPHRVHPIDAFLFSTKKGHCEFFATSLVLMLRSRGIPSRLVNGFYTSEYNNLAQAYSIRQSDAHTWVEVWLDGLGWFSVDPTPPGSAGRAGYGRIVPSLIETWNEYLRLQWQRLVIDYSLEKQLSVVERLKRAPGMQELINRWAKLRQQVLARVTENQAGKAKNFEDMPTPPWVWLIAATFCIGLGLGTWRLMRRWFGGPKHRSNRSGIDYFDALLIKLESLGQKRSPAQTPAELITGLQESGWNAPELDWLLNLYHLQRYADEKAGADDRRKALDIIQQLRPPAIPQL